MMEPRQVTDPENGFYDLNMNHHEQESTFNENDNNAHNQYVTASSDNNNDFRVRIRSSDSGCLLDTDEGTNYGSPMSTINRNEPEIKNEINAHNQYVPASSDNNNDSDSGCLLDTDEGTTYGSPAVRIYNDTGTDDLGYLTPPEHNSENAYDNPISREFNLNESRLSIRTNHSTLDRSPNDVKGETSPMVSKHQSNTEDQTKPTESTCGPKQHNGVGDCSTRQRPSCYFLSRLLIIVASCASCVMCFVVLVGCSRELSSGGETTVRLPCDDLSKLYPVAQLHEYTDDITNRRFKSEGIRRVKDNAKGVTSCEVSLTSILGRISKDEYTGVQGHVKLVPASKGPTRGSSSYNLSVTKAELGTDITHDPQAIILQTEGDYFIYFRLELNYGSEENTRCRDLRYKTFIAHALVQEKHLPEPRTLMGAEHTCCISCDKESKTFFTGGLYHLKEKDRLFIQVSSPQVVKKSGEHSFGVIGVKTN